MRGKIAKNIRRVVEEQFSNESDIVKRRIYKDLKRRWKKYNNIK